MHGIWEECKQEKNETINDFLVRLCTLWREQKPHETESDLAQHFLCRICDELFNMIGVSRKASLDDIMAEAQQLEDILYRRGRAELLSNQLKYNPVQKVGKLPKKHNNDGHSDELARELNNKYSVERNMATCSHYLKNQIQRTVDTDTSQRPNSYEYYSYKNCPKQYDNYR